MATLRLAATLATALTLGLAWAHVLEWPGKLRLDGPTWLAVQQNLYVGFGTLGAAIYVGAVALCAVLGWRTRRRGPVVAAMAALLALVSWALLVAPANAVIAELTPATLGPDWTSVRLRWEAGHAVGAALLGVALLALLLDRDKPAPPR